MPKPTATTPSFYNQETSTRHHSSNANTTIQSLNLMLFISHDILDRHGFFLFYHLFTCHIIFHPRCSLFNAMDTILVILLGITLAST